MSAALYDFRVFKYTRSERGGAFVDVKYQRNDDQRDLRSNTLGTLNEVKIVTVNQAVLAENDVDGMTGKHTQTLNSLEDRSGYIP